jgi:hypothetical protein
MLAQKKAKEICQITTASDTERTPLQIKKQKDFF